MKHTIKFTLCLLGLMATAACQKIEVPTYDVSRTGLNIWVGTSAGSIYDQVAYNFSYAYEEGSVTFYATLNEKAKSLQADYEEFERKLNNNAFATRERAESEQNRILKKSKELEELQERLGNELAIESNKNNILFRDSINAYINAYNKEKGYNVILSRIGDNILYIDSEMNITYDIIEGLNARYEANKK